MLTPVPIMVGLVRVLVAATTTLLIASGLLGCGRDASTAAFADGGIVLTGDVDITTAADLERLRGVARVRGIIRVSTPESGISSLEALSSLERADGLVLQGQRELRSLAGLEALREVAGALELDDAAVLETIELPELVRVGAVRLRRLPAVTKVTLPKLEQAGGAGAPVEASGVVVTELPELRDLVLPRLRATSELRATGDAHLARASLPELVAADVVAFESCPELVRVELPRLETAWSFALRSVSLRDGLAVPRLLTVTSRVVVAETSALRTLGTGALRRVGESLDLFANAALEDLAGLDELAEVGALNVEANSALTDTASLRALRRVTGSLRVTGNGRISSLAFESLERAGDLVVEGGASLAAVRAPRLVALTERLSVEGCPSLATLDLPALATVGRGGGGASAAVEPAVRIAARVDAVRDVRLGLVRVRGALLTAGTLASLAPLASLEAVEGDLVIEGALVPRSAFDALVTSLQKRGGLGGSSTYKAAAEGTP